MSTYYVTKSRTSLYFPQQLSQLATTWFVARQVWFLGGKTRNIAIQLVLQQCCITSCTFSLKVNSDLRPRPHLGCDNMTSTPGEVLCPAVLVKNTKNRGLLVLLSVAGSQNLPQVDLILYLPNTYPARYSWKRREKSPFSKIFGYKWTGLKLGKDNNNLFYMIKIKYLYSILIKKTYVQWFT